VEIDGLGLCGNHDGGFPDFDEAETGPLPDPLFARLNELDIVGEMIGDLENVRGMEAVLGAESRNTPDHFGVCDAAVEMNLPHEVPARSS